MLTLKNEKRELYQWDFSVKATVNVNCNEVHFSETLLGDSMTVLVNDGEVEIPNQLLTSAKSFYCWAFVINSGGGYTIAQKKFDVRQRPKPSNYVYEETEVKTISSVVEKAIEEAIKSGDFTGETGETGEKGESGHPIVRVTNSEEIILVSGGIPADMIYSRFGIYLNEIDTILDVTTGTLYAITEIVGDPSAPTLYKVESIGTLKGDPGKDGKDGKDYVLTDADKTEIANEVENEVKETLGEQQSVLNQICAGGKNLFNPSNIERGYFNYTTGEKMSSAAANQPYRTSEPIYLPSDGYYVVQWFNQSFTAGTLYLWMYDKDFNFLGQIPRGAANSDKAYWFKTIRDNGTVRYLNFSFQNCEPRFADVVNDIDIMVSFSGKTSSRVEKLFVPYDTQKPEIPNLVLPSIDKRNRYKFNGKLLNVGYSDLTFTPINTLENFLSVWKCGFNACKGDVRITSDNKLIMCHDEGFTFDADGRISATYDATNQTLIRDMTYAECMSKEYMSKAVYMGYNAKVADFEGYIYICKLKSMTPLITIRDEYIDEILSVMLPIIEKYELTYDCIINSMSYDTLVKLRERNEEIFATYTLNYKQVASIEHVNRCLTIGNCGLCLFTEPGGGDAVINNSSAAINYAKKCGIPLLNAQVKTMDRYLSLVNQGFSGFHITAPILDYHFIEIPLSINNNEEGVSIRDANAYTDRYTANVRIVGDTIEVTEIAHKGTNLPFADAVLNLWIRWLPKKITATNSSGEIVPCIVQDRKIVIKATEIGKYVLIISI